MAHWRPTCTSTCGPTSSWTGCGRGPGRRSCAAGPCTPTANRPTSWTRPPTTRSARVAVDHEDGGRHRLREPLRAARHRGAAATRRGPADRGLAPRGRRAARPLPRLGLGAGDRPRPRGAARAARRPAVRRPPGPGHPAAHPGRVGAGRRRGGGGRGRRRTGARPPRTGHRARRSTATCPAGGPPWSATPASSPRRGGRGTRCPAGRSSRGCGWSSRRRPDWGRCTTSGTRCAAARTGRSTRRCTSTPPATARARSTPWSGCSASTRWCSARTGPTRAPLTELFGEAATHAVRVTNPARLLGGVADRRTGMAVRELTWVRPGRRPDRPGPRPGRAGGAGGPRRRPPRGVGPPRRLRRRGAGLRLAAPRQPRRRLAAVLDAGERHRLARPRRLVGRGGGGVRRAGREQPDPHRRRPRAPGRAGTTFSFGPDHIHRLNGAVHGFGLGARLQPAAVADGPVPRRRRRHPQAGLAVVRRRAATHDRP